MGDLGGGDGGLGGGDGGLGDGGRLKACASVFSSIVYVRQYTYVCEFVSSKSGKVLN